MADIYNPEGLREDAVVKKMILDLMVEVQALTELLRAKAFVSNVELDPIRTKIRQNDQFKMAYETINKMNAASDLYKNDPQQYLKELFKAKMEGRVR